MKIDAESPNSHRVRPLDRLVEGGEPVERRDRAEHLLAGEVRVVGDVLEDGRRDEVALAVAALASRQHRAALVAPPLDRGEDVVARALADERADLGLRVGRVADLARGDAREELLAEGVVHGLLDEDPPRRGALLAGRPERARVGGLDGAVELGVRHHDERVLAAELELHAAAAGGRGGADAVAHRDRAGERDRAHVGALDERRADLRAGAGEHVQDAGGEPRLGEALGDVEAGARRVVRELEHDGVAVDQRGRELPDRDRDREVPGRDQADDAERAAARCRGAGAARTRRTPRRPAATPRRRRSGGSSPRGRPPCAPRGAACPSRRSCRGRSAPCGPRSRPPCGGRTPPGPGAGSAAQAGNAARGGRDGAVRVVGRRRLEDAGDGRGAPRVALLVGLARACLEPLAADVVAGRRARSASRSSRVLSEEGRRQRDRVDERADLRHVDLDPVAGDEAERVGRDEAGARQEDRPGRDRVLLDEPRRRARRTCAPCRWSRSCPRTARRLPRSRSA